MLTISRRVGEKIVIGNGPDRVTLVLLDIDRGRIRLGVDARRDMPVMREELLTKVSLPREAQPPAADHSAVRGEGKAT